MQTEFYCDLLSVCQAKDLFNTDGYVWGLIVVCSAGAFIDNSDRARLASFTALSPALSF
jgi:hypothetical protein